MISEYWTNGPSSELPPGHWCLHAQSKARQFGAVVGREKARRTWTELSGCGTGPPTSQALHFQSIRPDTLHLARQPPGFCSSGRGVIDSELRSLWRPAPPSWIPLRHTPTRRSNALSVAWSRKEPRLDPPSLPVLAQTFEMSSRSTFGIASPRPRSDGPACKADSHGLLKRCPVRTSGLPATRSCSCYTDFRESLLQIGTAFTESQPEGWLACESWTN